MVFGCYRYKTTATYLLHTSHISNHYSCKLQTSRIRICKSIKHLPMSSQSHQNGIRHLHFHIGDSRHICPIYTNQGTSNDSIQMVVVIFLKQRIYEQSMIETINNSFIHCKKYLKTLRVLKITKKE